MCDKDTNVPNKTDFISREASEKLKQSEKIELFPELQVERYIDRIKFLADIENRYCVNCEKRKGKKNGKIKTLYEIGEAPCKACGVMDMMEDVDAYPPADVVEVVRCSVCKKVVLEDRGNGEGAYWCPVNRNYRCWDEFCNRGERRDDNG